MEPSNAVAYIKSKVSTAITAYLQVMLVAANTVFLAKESTMMVAIATMGIQWLWTSNIRKIAFAGLTDRLIYCLAATAGAISGLYVSKYLINVLY